MVFYDVYSRVTGLDYSIVTNTVIYVLGGAVASNYFFVREWEQVRGHLNPWQRAYMLVEPAAGEKVRAVTVKVMAEYVSGNVYVTDILLQGGNILSGWNPSRADGSNYMGPGKWKFVIGRDSIEQAGKVVGQ
jgi:hypothetical protein